MGFVDKVALVTGGTSGIGRAAAALLVDAGARVVIAGRRVELGEAAARELGERCDFVRADMAVPQDVEALVAAVVSRHGRLDCALNNAATTDGVGKRLADFDSEEWERATGANLRGVWACLRAEIAQMLAQQPAGGAIVNTASVNGLGAAPTAGLYSVAKAGVLALTKAAALDYATDGIRINALVAGAFDTPMLRGAMETAASAGQVPVDQVRARYQSLVPMGRIGSPREAAHAAVWLCSDEASYLTGHSMIVDGGMTAAFR